MDRYCDSARVEADILERVMKSDINNMSHCIKQYEHFEFHKNHRRHYAIIFEQLGKSLYDVLRSNNYRGFDIKLVQAFARQLLECLAFLHKIGLTHTDLKVFFIILNIN